MKIAEILGKDRIVPVLSFRSVEEGLAVSGLLVEAGIGLLEITLRTPAALSCIEAVSRAYPQARVGVGTVTEASQLREARAAGAVFGVSPGLTSTLAKAILAEDFPFLPGAASVYEIMRARAMGFRILKFFPAEALGGTRFLRALVDVLPDIRFCATGGIDARNVTDYLALPNLQAVGGSWMIRRNPGGDIDEALTRDALRALATLRRD
ncbi:MAG: bifunctional 4-hydroxy-2-oxoglutarate aldolase/2-dehydro-3-deoxy-phosphogluconate aldolase [Gammaproteobacteria bacterium]